MLRLMLERIVEPTPLRMPMPPESILGFHASHVSLRCFAIVNDIPAEMQNRMVLPIKPVVFCERLSKSCMATPCCWNACLPSSR